MNTIAETSQEKQKRKNTLKVHGWILLVGGLIAAAIVGNVKPGSWHATFGDNAQVFQAAAAMFTTACWIIGIVDLIRAARIKTD
jgi:hypothetical protein